MKSGIKIYIPRLPGNGWLEPKTIHFHHQRSWSVHHTGQLCHHAGEICSKGITESLLHSQKLLILSSDEEQAQKKQNQETRLSTLKKKSLAWLHCIKQKKGWTTEPSPSGKGNWWFLLHFTIYKKKLQSYWIDDQLTSVVVLILFLHILAPDCGLFFISKHKNKPWKFAEKLLNILSMAAIDMKEEHSYSIMLSCKEA